MRSTPMMDYVLNGRGHGELGEALGAHSFDPGYFRPYRNAEGRKVIAVNTGKTSVRKDDKGKLITNSDGIAVQFPVYREEDIRNLIINGDYDITVNGPATMTKDAWITLDKAVHRSARLRLRAWSDLKASAELAGFDGMSKMMLEHQSTNDPGEALVDFDGLTEGRNFRPLYKIEGLPLPITHSDFHYSARQAAISRSGGDPIGIRQAEAAGRRIAEYVERLTIGTIAGVTYGDSSRYTNPAKIYGYTNFPQRITKTDLTPPTGSNAEVIVREVLEMIELAQDQRFMGPYMLYHSTDWTRYMGEDYFRSGGNNPSQTLRSRLMDIEGIRDIRRLDFLPKATNPWTLLLVQMDSETARAVNGLDLTTIQWQSKGGLKTNFKSMCIWVPQLFHDYYGRCGIVHGTAS